MSGVRRLAESIWLDHDPRKKLMVTFAAYFDGSGGMGSTPAQSVGGYLSSVEQWLGFEKEWKELMNAYGITVPFHMKLFAHSVGPFAHFKDKPGVRNVFIKKMAALVQQRTRLSISYSVLFREYNDANERYHLSECFYSPYVLCASRCMVRVLWWARKRKVSKDDIEFVFEEEPGCQGDLVSFCERIGMPSPTFKLKKLAPLQAADHIAWECHKLCAEAEKQRPVEHLRKSLAALMKVPHHWDIFMPKDLDQACKELHVPRRNKERNLMV